MSDEKRVLVVEDDLDAVDIVEAALSEIGITTLSANDGDSGLEKAREAKPDLIILDVHMPGKSGFEVFSALKQDESLKDTLVVMLTGVKEKTGLGFSAEEMGEYFGSEPEAYIEKPVDPVRLQNTVSKLLGV
jgi:two-component system alkaline phosphatase synthesis response regulator PhoP